MNTRRKRSLGERVDDLQRRNVVLAVLLLVAVVASAIVSLTDDGVRLYHWATRPHPSWQSQEAGRVESLSAGYSLQVFESALGVPLLVRRSSSFTEDTFRGRGYWVQAVSDRAGTVVLFAVTVCDETLHPTFSSQGGPTVTLGHSTFAAVFRARPGAFGLRVDYQRSGATANSHFYEVAYGGNPGNYKSFAWGVDDACPSWPTEEEALYKRGLFDWSRSFRFTGPITTPSIQRFRHSVVVNTYAESAPLVDMTNIERTRFQIGVDRIRVRATSRNYYPPLKG
jgi:hypothetical protein